LLITVFLLLSLYNKEKLSTPQLVQQRGQPVTCDQRDRAFPGNGQQGYAGSEAVGLPRFPDVENKQTGRHYIDQSHQAALRPSHTLRPITEREVEWVRCHLQPMNNSSCSHCLWLSKMHAPCLLPLGSKMSLVHGW